MPKLLIINPAKNYGSTGKIVEQIGLLAKEHGWETCLIHAARYNKPSQLKCIKAGTLLTEKWHAFMAQVFDSQGLHSTLTTKKVIRKIQDFSPDIIHLHNIHGYFLNYPLLFRHLVNAKVPIVWTMHDCWPFTGHCTYFDMTGCEKWKTSCHHCPNLKDYPRSVFFDRSKKNYIQKKKLFTSVDNLTMVPVSNWLGELTKQSYMNKYPIRVIHNGIDLTVFRLQQSNLRKTMNLEGKFIVLGVSSNGFTGRKGFKDFVELSKCLPTNFQIIMIGLHRNELKKLPSNIIGKMRTANVEELVNYYNLADVYINPTYSDNFPTTNIEALACGTPVITYQTGGSSEAIDRKTGIVIDKGKVDALASAIIQMSRKPLSSIDCRLRAENLFEKRKCFNKYIELYKELLNNVC